MKTIQTSKRILILCEDGKSSRLYFESFKKDEKYKRNLSSVDIEVYKPQDNSPMGLVKEAIKQQKKSKSQRNLYDEIWLVFDKDRHPNLKQALNLADEKKFNCAISIVCFEFWILLHFEKTSKAFANCDDIISHIKSKNYITNYDKGVNVFNLLKDNIETAINNGKWIENQFSNDLDRGIHISDLSAYTLVHRLVEILIKEN